MSDSEHDPPQLVLPGEQVAISEEFLPGENTYEQDGVIFAAAPGYIELDSGEMAAHVRPALRMARPRIDDIVIGRVRDVRPAVVIFQLLHIRGDQRELIDELDGVLHISEIEEDYVTSTRDKFRPGDFVRARVIEDGVSIRLSTKGRRLGVVLSRCGRCGGGLVVHHDYLWCSECEWKEFRKLAADYDRIDD